MSLFPKYFYFDLKALLISNNRTDYGYQKKTIKIN